MSCIVLDIGSCTSKSGFATSDVPTSVIPSVLGRVRRRYVNQYPAESIFIGLEAMQQRKHLSLLYPVDHGHIDDFDDFEELYSFIMLSHQCELNPNAPLSSHDLDIWMNTSALMSLPPNSSTKHVDRLAELNFEVFGLKELCLGTGGTLALLGQGRSTGISVEIGDGITQIVPTIEGANTKEGTVRVDVGGGEITAYLQKMLCDKGLPFVKRDEQAVVRQIKEQYSYSSKNPLQESKGEIHQEYTLPDGIVIGGKSTIDLGNELFYAPEVLFNPSLVMRDEPSLTHSMWSCIRAVSMEDRRKLLRNISLSGGCTLLNGLSDRLTMELQSSCPATVTKDIKVFADPDRIYSSWKGGSVLCGEYYRQCHLEKLWVTHSEYEDYGHRILVEKTL